jgi:chromosome segregation ATPase
MTSRVVKWAGVLMTALAAGTFPAHAQVERSGGGESQRIMQQYQALAAEKTSLQAQLAQMKKDLDAAQSELASTKKERDALKQRVSGATATQSSVATLTASKETAEKNLDLYKQRMSELVARFRDMAGNMRSVEAERTQLRADLDKRNQAFDRCALDNVQLFDLNRQILDKYDHVGLFTKLSADEPFTRITRTRMDNLVVEYRERAEQLKVKKDGGGDQGPAAGAAPPASAPH